MSKKEKKHEIDMCNGAILPKMLQFSIPLMCSSILQLLFNAADIIVVGNFSGDNSLGAVGSTGSLINLLTNLFIGLSIGANVLAARYYGAKNEEELNKTVHTAMLVSLISGIFLTIVGIAFAKQILILMNAEGDILNKATLYLRIYFLGMTATMIYNFGSAILRAIGDTKRPLLYLSVSGVVNVILNLILVILFRMDVAGVAIATSISQCISAFLVVNCLMHESGSIRLDLKKLHIYKDKFMKILQVGLPAGFQGTLFSLSNVVIQSSINRFGDTVISGNSAAGNVEGFVYVAMNAFYQATISFTSQNVGAGKIKRTRKILLTGQACAIIVGLVLGNLAYLFGNVVLEIYTDDPSVIAAGVERMKIIATTYAFCGIMDVMVGALRGIGYSVMPMIVSLIGACGFRLVWIATIFQIPRFHKITTVYLSYPISWLLTALVHILCYQWAIRKCYREHGVL